MNCCYSHSDGHVCRSEATAYRVVELRQDPPCRDVLRVPVCAVHAIAVDMFTSAEKQRQAG